MECGLDKCAKATFFRRKLLKANNITLDITAVIKDFEPEESYIKNWWEHEPPKSLKTKMPPFYGISTSILTGQTRQIDQT